MSIDLECSRVLQLLDPSLIYLYHFLPRKQPVILLLRIVHFFTTILIENSDFLVESPSALPDPEELKFLRFNISLQFTVDLLLPCHLFVQLSHFFLNSSGLKYFFHLLVVLLLTRVLEIALVEAIPALFRREAVKLLFLLFDGDLQELL